MVRVCVLPSSCQDNSDTSKIVDAWYETPFDRGKETHSFPTQGWSQRSLTAKVAVGNDAWSACCAALLEGSPYELTAEVRRSLRCILWLVAEIRLERIVHLRVPVTSARDAGLAIGQLPGPVTLGQACWEEKCVGRDWMGNSYAWLWGCCRTSEDWFARDLLPQRPVDMGPSELRCGFLFEDEGRPLLMRNSYLESTRDLRREIFQVLPRIEGFFEDRLSPRDLSCISPDAKQSLVRLGCVYLSGIAEIPGEHDWPSFGPFQLVEELSVEIQDFYCGSDAWPPDPNCLRHCKCAAATAKKLSAFLTWLFPAVRRVSFFFDFPYNEPVPYPTPGITAMMRTLVSSFEAQIGRPIEVDVGIIGIWQLDFDSIDNVEALCQPGPRRDGLLAAYADVDGGLGLQGGFHSG